MLPIILNSVVGIFFLGNGIYNFFNEKLLIKYLENKGVDYAQRYTRLSGILLIIFGTAFMIDSLQIAAVIGLSLYLLISALVVHQFWEEGDSQDSINSLLHFAKNILMIILLYMIVLY